ncbi:MAG TPA: hypothetical protein PKC80_06910 [Burkholderiaceae bacterium]|nr:hypothetical protein [Burkholderiaceae bacterium]
MSTNRPFLRSSIAIAVLTALPIALQAQQQQKVSGPQARYWVQAETRSGLAGMMAGGAGGMGAAMGSLFGRGGSSHSKTLKLELGSVRDANPATGQHTLPPALNMGESVPLFGEKRAPREYVERDVPQWEERDGNMRILFFWGCGENAGPGQPVVLDTKEIMAGRLPANLRSAYVRDNTRGPALGRDRGFADWPNANDNPSVPISASLVGDHAVSSNISPNIRFSVSASNDYLDPVTMTSANDPSGGMRLNWNAVDRSLGYFATAMGMRETAPRTADMVMWNSSAQRMLGGEALMGFLPPAEVNRLVNERIVMAPSSTECVIPKQVLEAAGGQIFMSSLNAYGPELNVVHPPRPSDVRVEWKQEYSVKVRTRSSTSIMPMMAGIGSSDRDERPSRERRSGPSGFRGFFGR